MIEFGKIVKSVRMSRGIKGKYVANKLKVHITTYYDIEADRRSVTIERADEIASVFGMTLAELLRQKVSETLTKPNPNPPAA